MPALTLLSAKANSITDEEAWYSANQIPPIFLRVPNPNLRETGELPDIVPATSDGLIAVRAFRDETHGYVIYGEDFSAGALLVVWDSEFSKRERILDFSSWRRAPKVVAGDEAFVDQSIRFARIVDGILYISHSHSTYAKSSGGMNAYLSALDFETGELLWRSEPLVANAANFLVVGEGILTGYGFTAEADYLFVLDRHTGRTMAKTAVKSGPEVLALREEILHVRTYNTDYRFKVK